MRQIESIKFGNWFSLARDFLPDKCIHEFDKPWRTKNDDLLKLWHAVRNVSPDIAEILISCDFTSNLDDSVIILSHRADVPRLMRAMDVFIFPSKIEGFGIAAIEAQAAGLRCLISDTVPTSTHISELAIPLSLELSPVEWATIALNRDIFSEYSDRIEDYDMNKEIKKLEKLYLD